MRISLQPAFILHHRPYRETSLLLDILTRDHGRISLIARGVRKNRSKLRPLLQPFSPLLLSWQGKTELMTLQTAESQGIPISLCGECLLSGFYLNELLMRLLQKQDPHPQLYTIYHHTLLELAQSTLQQKHLRLFEKKLLNELGYGLQLDHSIPDRKPFLPDQLYQFHPEQGFGPCDQNPLQNTTFSGKSLLALASEQLEDEESLLEIKRLMRIALGILLGPKPLQSRKLFRGVIENEK
ncbi:MAG TPA: DNA repair protein RecO [Gammaproteobacteria bacterium]|nr:DNA repair protein RecO [Gammaproteobacteria bacterium]